MSISHCIITRFNIPTLGREGVIRASPNWLRNRFTYFDRFCFPSVTAQSLQNFRWLIYFDIETPDIYKERASAYARQMSNLKLRYGNLEDFSLERIRQDVREYAGADGRWVITTRLDNDDAISRDFVKMVQSHAVEGTRQVLNLTNGYIWWEGRVYRHQHRSNAFASVSEHLSDLATVFSTPHMELSKLAPLRQITTDTGWMQVIHGDNVSNRVRGVRVSASDVRRTFSLAADVELRDPSRATELADRLMLSPIRAMRDSGIDLAKRVMGRRFA
jgi:hypothetical protein